MDSRESVQISDIVRELRNIAIAVAFGFVVLWLIFPELLR